MPPENLRRILCSFIINRDVVLVLHQVAEVDPDSSADYRKCMINAVKDVTFESQERQKFTMQQEHMDLTLHAIVKAGNVYGCISPKDVPQYVCFLFLSKVCDQMAQQPSLISRSYKASEHEFDRDFKPVLSRLMDEFNSGIVDDKLTTIQEQVQDVKEIILRNVESVLERGERLDDLLNKTNDLETQGRQFRQSARTLEIRTWWRNVWLWLVIGVILSVCVLFAILYFVNVFKH